MILPGNLVSVKSTVSRIWKDRAKYFAKIHNFSKSLNFLKKKLIRVFILSILCLKSDRSGSKAYSNLYLSNSGLYPFTPVITYFRFNVLNQPVPWGTLLPDYTVYEKHSSMKLGCRWYNTRIRAVLELTLEELHTHAFSWSSAVWLSFTDVTWCLPDRFNPLLLRSLYSILVDLSQQNTVVYSGKCLYKKVKMKNERNWTMRVILPGLNINLFQQHKEA